MQLKLDLVPLHLFFVNSDYTVPRLQNKMLRSITLTVQGANKINYALIPYTGILLISVQRRERAV